jgi:AAA domain/Winged helix-turn-helix DNA-binding
MNDAPRYEDFKAAPLARIKGIADFLREYEPINYTIDGLVPGGSIYGVTARRGAGKTALLTSTALAVATGDDKILGLEVEKGRAAYIILENPTDFRMKLSVTAYVLGIDVQALNDKLVILDMRLPHAQIMELLKRDADRLGPFQLVNYDTFQAGFAGAQFNDNNDALKHAQNLREFTTLPGKPSVLVACHPVKNATKDNLEPYGGGSTMNEFDGNLTLWNEGGVIELSHNKVRGPEFEPMNFRIEKIGSPEILDNKDRQPLLPVLRPISAADAADREKVAVNKDVAILKAMAADPSASIRDLAETTKASKTAIARALDRLAMPKGGKLVAKSLDKWTLTAAGLKAIEGRL